MRKRGLPDILDSADGFYACVGALGVVIKKGLEHQKANDEMEGVKRSICGGKEGSFV